jgi:hypothetical protein
MQTSAFVENIYQTFVPYATQRNGKGVREITKEGRMKRRRCCRREVQPMKELKKK